MNLDALELNDPVTTLQGAQPMGHHHNGMALAEMPEGIDHRRLRQGVERAGGLIEYKHFGLLHQ